MTVFITGATGYVGFNVATAFRRAGYRVLGVTRSASKAHLLARHEIVPVIGRMEEPDSYRHAAEECEILVHAAVDYTGDAVGLDKRTVETLLTVAQASSAPKRFLYTSGVWVYGDTGSRVIADTEPVNPIELVCWRPAVERQVLDAPGVNSVVLRPGCLYGYQGGLTAPWFDGAVNQRSLRIVGDGRNRWSMVHANDVADAYVRAAGQDIRGEVLALTDGTRATIGEMVSAVKRAAGSDTTIEFIPVEVAEAQMGGFARALALDQQIDSGRARRLLGWQPRHPGFIQEVDLCLESWRAWHSETTT